MQELIKNRLQLFSVFRCFCPWFCFSGDMQAALPSWQLVMTCRHYSDLKESLGCFMFTDSPKKTLNWSWVKDSTEIDSKDENKTLFIEFVFDKSLYQGTNRWILYYYNGIMITRLIIIYSLLDYRLISYLSSLCVYRFRKVHTSGLALINLSKVGLALNPFLHVTELIS